MAEQLDAVAATLYTPLYARAHAARRVPEAGFVDPTAADLLARGTPAHVGVLDDRGNVAGAVWRAALMDRLTVEFCQARPEAVVVTAGIGPCTRRERLAGRVPNSVSWLGVDTAPVIELRRRVHADTTTTLVARSLVDATWADSIDPGDRPVIVLAEGVLMYLDDPGLATFLGTARQRFGAGTELVADYFHPTVALSGRHPIVRATGAAFRSGARDGRALAARVPGWTVVDEHDVVGRISLRHRAAGRLFRLVSGGGRLYAIARLRAI